MLRGAAFFLRELFAPHVLILDVSLGEVIGAEALAGGEIGGAIVEASQGGLEAPLRVRGRTRTAAAEILLEFNFQRADIALDPAQFFINAGHRGAPEVPEIPAKTAQFLTIVQGRKAQGAASIGLAGDMSERELGRADSRPQTLSLQSSTGV